MEPTNQQVEITYSKIAIIPTYGLFHGKYKLSINLKDQCCYITGDGNTYSLPIISPTGDDFHPDLWVLDGCTIECEIKTVDRTIVITPSNDHYRNSGIVSGVYQYFTFNGQRIKVKKNE